MPAPKLFISYSWASPSHEQLVIDLATELRESGVDVILDKWELKEGHDAVAFMEQMVTNPEIKKVAIVSDRTYAEKADGRAGGVGTETQIISSKVYEKQVQEKFVLVVTEKDSNGKPFLPTYYKSRVYIDLSEPDSYSENFERLLRWIFDKPLYVKPEIGNAPSFVNNDEEHLSLGTTAIFKRCVDALKNSKPYATGALDDYCTAFVTGFERFRIAKPDGEFDDAVVKNIEEFLPFRNEAIQVFTAMAHYSPTTENVQRIHKLFEDLIPYMDKPPQVSQWTEWDFDNFRFVIHELFLYFIAILLKSDRIEQAANFFDQQYYVPGNSDYGTDVMVSFSVMQKGLRSLAHRNDRLRLNRLSVRADILKQRCLGGGLEFRHLMQADFVSFMRAEIHETSDFARWWPETLVYIGHFHSAFEIFARSVSKAYFNRVKGLLGIEFLAELEPLIKSYQEGKRRLPTWQFDTIHPAVLLGYDKLATRA